jgi:oxygen-independent coproporphyrinogen-3 oxidase
VHLPFCAAKCHYCDFFSVPAEGQDVEGTLQAVIAELRVRAPHKPATVFLGGGTPSLLSIPQLAQLFRVLDAATEFRESAREVTIECNPESLERDKALALLELGVTRFSIGFQSLRAETLELFGRVHSVERCFEAFDAVRAAGATNVNVDLIYASPGQALEDWQADLERVLALGPEHVSAYNLTFEEDTQFKRWLERGQLAKLDEERELEFLRWTRGRLAAASMEPYEVSNFALDGRQCLHNVNYWHNGEYVGIGPSAVSKLDGQRFGNTRHLADYRRGAALARVPIAWHEAPHDAARLGETWWLGLRLTEGLSPEQAWSRAGLSAWSAASDPALAIAQRLAQAELLCRAGDRWRLTERGLPVADAVAREFLRLDNPDLSAAASSGTEPARL